MKSVEGCNDLRRKFISKRDVINICNKLRNTQDKILIYATYSGVTGDKLEDLRNLKYSDFCPLEEVVVVKDREVKIDYFLQKLLEEGKDEKVYYINNGNVANGAKNKFEINTESEYVLKGKPTTVNNNGKDPIGYPSLQSRMKTISEIVGINLTYNTLHRSKVVEDMCLLKKDWRHKEVDEYLKNNKLKFKASNILPLIKEVTSSKILDNNELKLVYKKMNRVSKSKLTTYQEESIRGLYKIVAGLSMVNGIQKRKIENEHYRVNEEHRNREFGLRDLMQSLIEVDKIYWEFIVNEQFNEQDQEYLIKIYADKEQYEKQNERYYISYQNGEYNIFANIEYEGPGKRDDLQNELYSGSDCTNIISKIIDDFNEVNKEKRALLIKSMPYSKKEKQRFTPPYLNDVGLDMLLALNSMVEFKMAKLVFEVCEKIEEIEGISKATPCIDVSTEGETFIVVIKDNGDIIHLKFENPNGVKVLKSIGKSGRCIELKNIHDIVEYFSRDNDVKKRSELLLAYVSETLKIDVEEKMNALKKAIDLINDDFENIGEEDDFLKIKNKEYLHYYQRNESSVIFSMYDYDLCIEYNTIEEAYMVKRYIELKGTAEKIYDVYKTRDVEDLVKWLSMVKMNNYENLDYSIFLVG